MRPELAERRANILKKQHFNQNCGPEHEGRGMGTQQKKKRYIRVLTIAGSDSGGGAGVQADLKTIAASGCYATSVITALTAQNTLGVKAIHPVPGAFVQKQLEAVLSDIGSDAVKIGMLLNPELIELVAEQLKKFRVKNIVLDPVMVAQSGDKLLEDEAVAALKQHLIPLADLITPNLPEAAVLLDRKISHHQDLAGAVSELAQLGCANVLLKGGHLESEDCREDENYLKDKDCREAENCDDFLYIGAQRKVCVFPATRIKTVNNHGTGCTLSSAIASGLAKGEGLEEAVRLAKEYITGAIAAGARYAIGNGRGPVDHFFRFFPVADD